jgi:hypothetical protein
MTRLTVLFGESENGIIIQLFDGKNSYSVPTEFLNIALRYKLRSDIEKYLRANFKSIKVAASIKVKSQKGRKSSLERYQADLEIEIDAFFDFGTI